MDKPFQIISLIAVVTTFTLLTFGQAEEKKEPSATIEIDQVQVAFMLSGNLGGGKLHFQGKTFPFQIGGLGIGGIGASSIHAEGDVYDLKNTKDFPGVYVQGRVGLAIGDQSAGDLWLQNDKDVYLHLKAKREGLMLSAGADGIVIEME